MYEKIEEKDDKIKNMKVWESTKDEIDRFKIHPKEPYREVVERLVRLAKKADGRD